MQIFKKVQKAFVVCILIYLGGARLDLYKKLYFGYEMILIFTLIFKIIKLLGLKSYTKMNQLQLCN